MDKDEGAQCEVEVTDGVCVLLLELADGGMSTGEDAVVDGSKVSGTLLELAGMDSEEFFS